jgi:hypothetical protein
MEILSELTVERVVKYSATDSPFAWVLVTNTTDVVLPTPEAEVWTVKPTNKSGIIQNRSTWVSYTPCTFNLVVDSTDATHIAILAAVKSKAKIWLNIAHSDTSPDAMQFACYVNSATDEGTDGGGYTRNITVTPCGNVTEDATPAP